MVDFPLVADDVLAKVRRVCVALPETTESPMLGGAEFKIRRRMFASVFSITDPQGRDSVMLVCRADPGEREVLRAIGHPFFIPGSGADRIGMVLEATTDWTEVAELVTESYRIQAPKKLAALIDAPPIAHPPEDGGQ